VLIEREADLDALSELAEAALGGRGHVVLVGGEAGVGKTSLVTTLVAQFGARLTVRSGGCDDLTVADAYGPFIEAVPELADRIGPDAERSRILRWLYDLFAGQPSLLVLEDVHWADGATLDALRHLGRRTGALPLLVIVTYRSEAVAHRPALRRLLGELASTPATARLDLAPLTRDGVRALVTEAGARTDPDRVHDETGGNPFFVSEVLASGLRDVPATVRDAVLARTATLGSGARRALSSLAVLGTRCPVQLIVAVAGCSERDIADCVANGILVESEDGCTFRHELARRAIESTLAVDERARLHRAALAALRGADDRRLAHHAIGCGDSAGVLRHARLAGERAGRLGAHREAAEHFRSALRHGTPDAAQRAALLEALSYECYLTEQLQEALAARLQRLDLAIVAGEDLSTGTTLRWLSRLSWYLGRNADAERYAARAVQTLTALGESPALAMAISNVAQLRMLAGDHAAAIETGARAIAVARAVGDRDTEIHALNNVGTARLATGDPAGGTLLARSLDLALAAEAHEHAARAYTNLASQAAVVRDLPSAERHLQAGIRYCVERDLDSWRWYMSAWVARVQLDRGDLAAAATTSADVLAVDTAAITRIVASVVAAQVRLRRGEAGAGPLLDDALALAETTGEAQRLVPVASARAEWAWLDGRTADIAAEVDRAWPAAVGQANGWDLGELCWWLGRAGIERDAPVPLPPPFTLLCSGAWSAAGAAWAGLGFPLWQLAALSCSPALRDAHAAIDQAHSIGAFTWERAIRRDRVAAGLPVPRPVRPGRQELPHRLTARELEVLNLLADGLSNSEISTHLVLSEKTVGHHVSAVLHKLGAPTRSRAVVAALREGIVEQKIGNPPDVPPLPTG
jgi:DNA-binding CsgD family transcriptional regulator/tetratricopeptide (TPR) repeat protein